MPQYSLFSNHNTIASRAWLNNFSSNTPIGGFQLSIHGGTQGGLLLHVTFIHKQKMLNVSITTICHQTQCQYIQRTI